MDENKEIFKRVEEIEEMLNNSKIDPKEYPALAKELFKYYIDLDKKRDKYTGEYYKTMCDFRRRIESILQNIIFEIDPQKEQEFYKTLSDEELGFCAQWAGNEFDYRITKQYDERQTLALFDIAQDKIDFEKLYMMVMKHPNSKTAQHVISKIDIYGIDAWFAEKLIGFSGDKKLALEYRKSKQFKKFREEGDFESARFLLTCFGGNYRKLYNYYVRHYAGKELENLDEGLYADDIKYLILENSPKYGTKLLLGKRKIEIEGYRLDGIREKYTSNEKLSKCKRKRVEALIVTSDTDELIDYLLKNVKTLSTSDKEAILANLPAKAKDERLLRSLIDHGEKYYTVKELKNKWRLFDFEIKVVEVDKPSDISLEEMKKEKVDYVTLNGDCNYYTRREFAEIKKALDIFLDGIPQAGKDAKNQLHVFKEIYKRIRKIKYDYSALKKSNKDIEAIQTDSRSLYNGLVKGKCVCVGYAKILRVALLERGIDAKVIGRRNAF